jgi:hypothetical protein
MYYQLTDAVKTRLIRELRDFWMFRPEYPDLSNNIQSKYSFDERPQRGIIVKVSGANRFDLSADNYIGINESYIHLTRIPGSNGTSIDWVIEDSIAIQKNGGLFPSSPGIYYIEITGQNEFYVDPLTSVYNEQMLVVDSTTLRLQNVPVTGTLRLYEMPSAFQLYEGTHYTLETDAQGTYTGDILLTEPSRANTYFVSDYRVVQPSRGPFPCYPRMANNLAIPGVVLAFGTGIKIGDKMAVVVDGTRVPSSLEYGGRWDLSLDLEIFARDQYDQEIISDATMAYIWGQLRPNLSSQGLEIIDLSFGGEAEEVYDENGDDYFYNASISLTIQTEWLMHYPLNVSVRNVSPYTLTQLKQMVNMTDEEVAAVQSQVRMMESFGLDSIVDPYLTRPNKYAMIK